MTRFGSSDHNGRLKNAMLPDFCHHKSASLQSAHFSCETGKLSNDSSAQFCSLWGTISLIADVRQRLRKPRKSAINHAGLVAGVRPKIVRNRTILGATLGAN